jgi:iron complex outermembrane receptor protein
MSSFSFRPLLASQLVALLASAAPATAQVAPPAPSDPAAPAETPVQLAPVTVTASPESQPLAVVIDPRAPTQPIPAHDGADTLKTIPGMSVIRKGGTDGDPVFRGMAGSRLGIQLDGQTILGGCGMRMDPPTAYVFPASFDRVTLRKGPQTVLAGPGNSAGVVLFEHDQPSFCHPTADARASTTFGSFGRNDQSADVQAGSPLGYVSAAANRSASGDYEDGDGRSVHSEYERWSTRAALGWTPTDKTLVELSAARSDGEAAYADRTMDGVKFDRENLALRFRQRDLSPILTALDGQLYYNYVDHVMDNFSLRTPPGMRMLSNPDRETTGGKLSADFAFTDATRATAGADFQANEHTLRGTTAYKSLPRVADGSFDQLGLFAEATHELNESRRLIAGARLDWWEAEKTAANLSRDDTLPSGFARYEHDVGPATAYVGVGHAERFPDFWEIIGGQPAKPDATFLAISPEKTTQLDLGVTYKKDALRASLAGFASQIDDYILLQPALAARTRNIDARTFGGEASLAYAFASGWEATGSLAYVRGTNETDDLPLAQMPPLEGRLGLSYSTAKWSAGGLLRLVAPQDRVAPGQGNIVGQDIGTSDGFAVVSLNGGYQLASFARLSAGVDNLLDATYAEHISRSGAAIAGFPVTTRVNEPGLNLWIKLDLTY